MIGNTEVEAANKLDLYYGNELEIRRFGNKWDYEAEWDKEETGLKRITQALLWGIILGDFLIGGMMEFGRSTDGSKAKITIGVVSTLASLTIMTIHILEFGGLLARTKANEGIHVFTNMKSRIVNATNLAMNTALMVNPYLKSAILTNLEQVYGSAVDRINNLIDESAESLKNVAEL